MSRCLKLHTALIAAGWTVPADAALEQLAIAVRATCDFGSARVMQTWPKVSFACCAVSPVIRKHPPVAKAEQRLALTRAEARRHWTYEELAVAVLRAAGGPLHWYEIAARAEAMGHREHFTRGGLFNILSYQDVFARTGNGTYALVEQGYKSAKNYTDIIAEVLTREGKALNYGELALRVDQVRPIKPASLQMFLDTHPRFYRATNGSYGLRGWLPPREKQTLRTPEWLAEDKKSAQRLAIAEARGYNVAAIAACDQLPPTQGQPDRQETLAL